jgi:hypothetical protein
METEVWNSLEAVAAIINYYTIAIFEFECLSYLWSNHHHVANQRFILRRQLGLVILWKHDKVFFRNWVGVFKGDAFFVLVVDLDIFAIAFYYLVVDR